MNGELRTYGPEHESGVIDAESYAFAVPRDLVPKWLERAGHENVRVWMSGDRVAGAVLVIPMGIWFGGRSVKNLGIAGVAIGPEHRGQNHGYEMMAATLREAKKNGWAVSTLYPATITLYRKVGYELAGGHYSLRLPLDSLSVREIREKEGKIVPVTSGDRERLAKVLTPTARPHDGNLDRGPYVWNRIFSPRLMTTHAFAADFDGEFEGYVVLRATDGSHPPFHELTISDLVAKTPRAMRRLLCFLADHRSLAKMAEWTGDPHEPFLALLPEKTYQIQQLEHWMLRVVDPRAALEARGYRCDRPIALEVELEDREIPENSGRFRLELEGGRAQLTSARGGPRLRAKIGAFSALYAGFQPASVLAQLGWIEGDAAAIEAAELIFAGRSPWMREMF